MGTPQAGRRSVLKGGIGLAVGLSLNPGLAAIPADTVSQDDPASLRPKPGDRLVKVDDPAATPLTPDDIPRGAAQTMAWAMDPAVGTVRSASRLNRVLLLRLDAETLSPETRARSADGVVAYTAICTHNGCEVIEWVADEQRLSCPCHLSRFDPADGAKILDGPAPRPLPALPLTVVDGKLVVAKPFTTRVGFDPA